MAKTPKKGQAKKKEVPQQPPFEMNMPFAHRVLRRDWVGTEELNKQLKLSVWQDRARDPQGLYRSNLAGTWHSRDAIFDRLGWAGNKLREMFGQQFSAWAQQQGVKEDPDFNIQMRMSAWAMVYSDRGYATVHSHPNCHVSGVYYVDNDADMPEKVMATGLQVRAGDIEFFSPVVREHQLGFMRLNENYVVPYKDSRMLVFPSYLPHMVHPMHTEGGERISIACNCTFYTTPKEKSP